MGKTVKIRDAKTRLSHAAFRPKRTLRKPGRMRGAIRVSHDFDAPLPDDLFDYGIGGG